MRRKLLSILDVACTGVTFALGGIVAGAALCTKLTGRECITFSFNRYGEHLIEAIMFPAVVIIAFTFWLIKAERLGRESRNGK